MDTCDKSRSLTGFQTCFSAFSPKALAVNIFIKAMHFVSCFRSMMFIHSEVRSFTFISRKNKNVVCEMKTQESLRHYTAFVRVSAKIVCLQKPAETLLVHCWCSFFFHPLVVFFCVLRFSSFYRGDLNEKFDVVTLGRGEKEKSNDNSFAIITTAHRENHYIVSLLWTLFSSNGSSSTTETESAVCIALDWKCHNIATVNLFLSRILFALLVHSLAVVLQQTYISCYLRCNFMFSRLLRILMFMFFFSFSALTSFSLQSSLAFLWSRRKE